MLIGTMLNVVLLNVVAPHITTSRVIIMVQALYLQLFVLGTFLSLTLKYLVRLTVLFLRPLKGYCIGPRTTWGNVIY
jgi:hypothetical protein